MIKTKRNVNIQSDKWIKNFFCACSMMLLFFALCVYIIDPFYQFRVRDNSYMLNGWLVGSGLIENYDYDTLIVGSSLTQNFNMYLFRKEMNVKPLHVGLGGMNKNELIDFVNLSYSEGKAQTYYICIDLVTFTHGEDESRYPKYLLKKDALSRGKYFLSYEAWFRYIPVDFVLSTANMLGVKLPEKYQYKMSIDKLGDWSLDYQFGEEIVTENYINQKYSVSDVDTTNLYTQMIECIDDFFEKFNFTEGKHVFFFPPYSDLYWCDAQDCGYFEIYLDAKEYFIEKANIAGVDVFDFQGDELTMNLDNYKDTTHYSPQINDYIIKCFANGQNMTSVDKISEMRNLIVHNTNQFREQHIELFED